MKKSNKGLFAAIIATMFFTFTTSAQTMFIDKGEFLYDTQTGVHYDKSTRTIGSWQTSNPSPNPYRAYRDNYNQAVTYSTPGDLYMHGYDYHQPAAPVVYQQPVVQQPTQPVTQPVVGISIVAYFFTPDKEKLIAIGGYYDNSTHVFTPRNANYYTGSTWSSYTLPKESPLAELSFCGAMIPNGGGPDTWVSSQDQKWSTDKWYAYKYDGYASQAPIVNGVVQLL